MLRSLWTAASGMLSQQTNLDTISNNLSNVNTTGYKKETNEFKSLLYQAIQEKATDSEGVEKPGSIQVGSGVRNSAITSQFTQGATTPTENQFDFAIDGNGFFMVQMPDGTVSYTRSGSFQMAIGTAGLTLATSEGYQVLSNTGQPIVLPTTTNVSDLTVDETGKIYLKVDTQVPAKTTTGDATEETAATEEVAATDAATTMVTKTEYVLQGQMGLAQFNNPSGLIKTSGSFYQESGASGIARIEGTDVALKESKVLEGYLEASNVAAVDEMVNMIVAQRAYELNSKAITASDEMLQQANNLRG